MEPFRFFDLKPWGVLWACLARFGQQPAFVSKHLDSVEGGPGICLVGDCRCGIGKRGRLGVETLVLCWGSRSKEMGCPLDIGPSRRLLPRPRGPASAGILGPKPTATFKQRQPLLFSYAFRPNWARKPLHAPTFLDILPNGHPQLGPHAKP